MAAITPTTQSSSASITPTGRQYIRYCVLKVGKGGGTGDDLSNLRISFECVKNSASDPNTATIKVYNLNEQTANKILYEYDTVELEAGYADGNKGIIFHGNISEITHTREKYVDTIVEIKGEDGGNAYKYSTTSQAISKGATDQDLLNIVLGDYGKFDVNAGNMDTSLLSQTQYARGQVFHGNTREIAAIIARNHGLEISIQDNKLQVTQVKKTLDIQAEVISSETGLVDPGVKFNEQGVTFKTLLNTNLVVGCPIKIDESAYTMRYVNKLDHSKDKLPQSGSIYKVIQVKHSGDTRDKTWYTECTAILYTSETADQKDNR